MIKGIRGMNDLLPKDTRLWQFLEDRIREVVSAYAYEEIRTPVLEKTEIFARGIGEATDIVEKEMYTFTDRNGESLTMRPEGTAGTVRACLEHGMLHNQQQRLWYMGPVFRYERPQKGRYRQFHQFGVEVFGLEGPDVDAEIVLMTARLWKALGIDDDVELHINSLGSDEARAAYREALVDYFSEHKSELDEDSRRRLTSNPLRILDSKNPQMQELIEQAPVLLDYMDEASKAHFEGLKELLSQAGLDFVINPRLVRGLDYYNRTVFEWMTDTLGAQGSICGGGRYDGLVQLLGGKPTPGVGFGMGMERVALMLEAKGVASKLPPAVDAYLVVSGEEVEAYKTRLAEQIRDAVPGLKLRVHAGGGSFKKQLKRADKSDARWALIVGDEEWREGKVTVKDLRSEAGQVAVPLAELAQRLG